MYHSQPRPWGVELDCKPNLPQVGGEALGGLCEAEVWRGAIDLRFGARESEQRGFGGVGAGLQCVRALTRWGRSVAIGPGPSRTLLT